MITLYYFQTYKQHGNDEYTKYQYTTALRRPRAKGIEWVYLAVDLLKQFLSALV